MTVVAVGLAVLLVCGWRIRQLERRVADREWRLHAFQTWVADLSHDLKTPLTLLTGPVRDLLDGRHGDLPMETIRAFERAERNADRLEALTERLILDAKGTGPSEERTCVAAVDVADVVRSVVEQFRSHAERAGIVLGMASVGRDFHVQADPDALERILVNLLSNATKFTPRGGRVLVEVHACAVEGMVNVDVQDSGCGIRASEKDRLFDRFFRSDGTRRAVDGRGMGLNIAYKLLQEMGGGIRVDSTPGQGARFSITFPKGGGLPERRPVMVVSERSSVQACLSECFADQWDIACIQPGPEAVATIARCLPEFVVSTCLHGWRDALLSDIRTSHIPVVEIRELPVRMADLRAELERMSATRREVQRAFRSAVLRQGGRSNARDLLADSDGELLDRISASVASAFCKHDFNACTLADLAGLSLVHLEHKVRALSGSSVDTFIRDVRLGHAAWLLSVGRATGGQVWKAVGFQDPVEFQKAFQERFSESPAAFAANAAGNPLLAG